MKQIKSIIRIIILFALCGFGMILVGSVEQDNSVIAFSFRILMDKALGITAFIYMHRLYKRWSKIDPWLIAYNKMCKDVMEAPNPCQINKD